MSPTIYRFIAIIVANGAAWLVVRFVGHRLPELRGALKGLYTTVMLVGFSFFFHDVPFLWVSPLFLVSAALLIRDIRKRFIVEDCVEETGKPEEAI